MVEIKGKFTDGEGKPAAGACFRLTLGHDDPDAEFKVFEDGEEVDYSGDIFVLGSGGELPSGACVWGTDEIHPAGSHYSIEVGKIVGMHSRHYYSSKGRVEITGTGPVDLTPLPEPEPEAVVLKPPRQMPSPRKLGTNYRGFYAGVIHCPPTIGTCTSPGEGKLSAFTFTLPFRAAVSCVSIIMVVPREGRHVVVALYDTNGKRACAASIAAEKAGVCTGLLEPALTLNPGEYTLVWAMDNIEVQGLGNDYREQLQLMNGGEGGVVAGVVAGSRGCDIGTLPEQLGKIIPSTSCLPILAYFKF